MNMEGSVAASAAQGEGKEKRANFEANPILSVPAAGGR